MKNTLIVTVSSVALMFGAAQAGVGPGKAKPADETATEAGWEPTVDVEVAPEGEGDMDFDAYDPEEGDEGGEDEEGSGDEFDPE